MSDYLATDTPVREDANPPPADKQDGPARNLNDSAARARKWSKELKSSERWMEKFTRSARICERAYLDIEAKSNDAVIMGNTGKVNLFWSNTQVVMSAIYGRMPTAEVDRKFGDFQDDVARVAGIIMQRVLNSDIQREYDDTNSAMRDAVQDRFVVGLGQVWCRYECEIENEQVPVTDPMGQPVLGADGQPVMRENEKIVSEEAATDYVYWDDFRYSPCRRWRDCRWVARRCYMNEAKLRKRFNLTDEQIALVPMQTRLPQEGAYSSTDDVLRATPFTQAAVWEIWDRDSNTACWYVEGCSFILDEVPDPLELDDFFPCPQPVVATTLTKAFLPRADYAMAQDLYKELDRLNARICRLTEAIKAAGVYDKAASPVKSILTTAVENALVPVDAWAGFAEKGGLRGAMDFLPIEQFANALVQLQQRKAQVERDLYEVLGISDIMRGASVASETLGAQQLKVQYGGARLANLQNSVALFVAGVMKIRANIVSNFFQPETLIRRSLIDRTPDAPVAQQAIAMLKDYGSMMFNVTVTSDSLAAPDWEAEKSARTEFMGAASNYIMAAGPLVQQAPELGSFLIKLLQWGAAGFKGAKTIEGVLDQAAQQLQQKAAQPPAPPPPTPEDRKDEAAAKKSDADANRSQSEAITVDMQNVVMAAQLGLPPPPTPALGNMQPQGMPPPGAGMGPGALNAPGGMPMPQGAPGGAPGGLPQPSMPQAQPPAPMQ